MLWSKARGSPDVLSPQPISEASPLVTVDVRDQEEARMPSGLLNSSSPCLAFLPLPCALECCQQLQPGDSHPTQLHWDDFGCLDQVGKVFQKETAKENLLFPDSQIREFSLAVCSA